MGRNEAQHGRSFIHFVTSGFEFPACSIFLPMSHGVREILDQRAD
jgi:hypothetical protein